LYKPKPVQAILNHLNPSDRGGTVPVLLQAQGKDTNQGQALIAEYTGEVDQTPPATVLAEPVVCRGRRGGSRGDLI